MIREQRADRRFEALDRFAHYRESAGKNVDDLLDEFTYLREQNLITLRDWRPSDRELALEGEHPAFGRVTLRQLLAT